MDTYWADSTGRRNTFDYILFEQLVESFGGIGNDAVALEALLTDLLRRGRQYAAFAVGSGTDGREPPRIFWRPISPCYATISNVFKFA